MKIVFQKKATGLFDVLIRWWTKSPYSHCELLFDDGNSYSSMAGVGTRFIKFEPYNAAYWDVLDLPTSKDEDIVMHEFCIFELGCKYDWYGILASQIIKAARSSKTKWFCSEICTATLQRVGYFEGSVPSTFSPGKLYKRLREAGAKPCAP